MCSRWKPAVAAPRSTQSRSGDTDGASAATSSFAWINACAAGWSTGGTPGTGPRSQASVDTGDDYRGSGLRAQAGTGNDELTYSRSLLQHFAKPDAAGLGVALHGPLQNFFKGWNLDRQGQ